MRFVLTLDVYFGDNLPILQSFKAASIDLVYLDPPFNTGKVQRRLQLRTVREETGDRQGFQGKRYKTVKLGGKEYPDNFVDFYDFLLPRLEHAKRILRPNGSLFFHIDYREVHYCKVLLDEIFGRESFLNEIIWAYDYGARSRKKWPAKHDNILWYAVNPADYVFNFDEMDRISYMAPGLVGPEKAARGKTPTDVWWHTIVPSNGREKTGYPTQKPRGIIDRIVKIHSRPGDVLCDFFAGSGTFGASAQELGRDCILIDSNPQAIEVMRQRFEGQAVNWHM